LRSQDEVWAWNKLQSQEEEYHGFRDGKYRPAQSVRDDASSVFPDPFTACVANWLRRHQVSFVPFKDFYVDPPQPGWRPAHLRAAFGIGDLLLHVERQLSDLPQRYHQRDRRSLIYQYAPNAGNHRFLMQRDFERREGSWALTTDADLWLQQWLGLNEHAEVVNAPTLRLRIPGELRVMNVFELLYQEGVFIESLGIEVSDVKPRTGESDPPTLRILELLQLFWVEFMAVSAEKHLVRFHDVLVRLSRPEQLSQLAGRLDGLRHVFVDEFQDVSPELVKWLQALMTANADRGEVSLTAIGDDYQSIYGWRGSHPSFILDYGSFFPGHELGYVELDNNFRCRQEIIDAAESVLEDVEWKSVKHGLSQIHFPVVGNSYPVRLLESTAGWSEAGDSPIAPFGAFVMPMVRALLAPTAPTNGPTLGEATASILILARSNDGLAAVPEPRRIEEQLLNKLRLAGLTRVQRVRVRALTFHRAKGLEADFVLLLEDSLPPDPHPLRDLVYRRAHLPGTYTENETDESRRLAYVALTRARLGVLWIPAVRGANDSEDGRPKNTGCYAKVSRYLDGLARHRSAGAR
jgi:superfamily I DNA/RNA helicase